MPRAQVGKWSRVWEKKLVTAAYSLFCAWRLPNFFWTRDQEVMVIWVLLSRSLFLFLGCATKKRPTNDHTSRPLTLTWPRNSSWIVERESAWWQNRSIDPMSVSTLQELRFLGGHVWPSALLPFYWRSASCPPINKFLWPRDYSRTAEHWFLAVERILLVTKKSGNRERCRKLSLWNRILIDFKKTNDISHLDSWVSCVLSFASKRCGH